MSGDAEEDAWPFGGGGSSSSEDEAAADVDERSSAASTAASGGAGSSSSSGKLTSDSVASWLKDLAARSNDADLMGSAYRPLRAQVVALAKRLNAINAREQRATLRRRYAQEMERQRSSDQMLPPPSTAASDAASVQSVILTAGGKGRKVASPRATAALLPASASANDAASSAAAESSASTALSVPGSSGSTALATADSVAAPAWRKAPKQAAPPKAHLVSGNKTLPGQLNRHQLQDLSRTVRQLRHMSAPRCYVCKAPLFNDAAALEAAGVNEEGIARGRERHSQFTNHCAPCGAKNERKRDALVDLRGRIAVLTGARIKIGYQIGIRLLRCGATVLATTRFPANALCRYRQEADYDQWKDRLHLLYADLCNPGEVRALAARIRAAVPHVDILINNAAQTVRRPLPYYHNLNAIEHASQVKLLQEARENHVQLRITPHPMAQPSAAALAATSTLPNAQRVLQGLQHAPTLVAAAEQLEPRAGAAAELHRRAEAPDETDTAEEIVAAATASSRTTPADSSSTSSCSSNSAAGSSLVGASAAAAASVSGAIAAVGPTTADGLPSLLTLSLSDGSGALELPGGRHFTPFSLIPSLDEFTSAEESARLFPSGKVDSSNDHEPLDLRAQNSWTLKAEEVDPRELAEVLSTNAMAPFVLCQELKGHMEKSPNPHRFVILVSSMEGKLNRSKQDAHVHTNMAKAALNAFTRSVAAEWAAQPACIYVNSVDTGWNSEERPVNDPKRDPTFETPLDCADGAARVLDPIFVAETEQRYIFGQFLKDYAPSEW